MPKQGAAASKFSCKALILAGTILGSGVSSAALAQVAGQASPPPVRQSIDANGVDVSRGAFVAGLPSASIGSDAKQGLVYSIRTDGVANQVGTIEVINGQTVVTIDGASDSFTSSGGGYVSTEGNGATLTLAAGIYTYTSRDGITAVFASNSGYVYPFYEGELARLGSVTYPDGTKKT